MTAERATPVSSLTAVTVTPGSTAPVASATRPSICPYWANAGAARKKKRAAVSAAALEQIPAPEHLLGCPSIEIVLVSAIW